VLINVSHENPTWCGLLLHQKLMIPVVSSLIALSLHGLQDVNEETSARAFDRLCLALGLLTNLVQVDEDAKDICRKTSESPVFVFKPLRLKDCRARSLVSSPPPMRVCVQLSEGCHRSGMSGFSL